MRLFSRKVATVFLENGKKVSRSFDSVSADSDFMILDAWTSVVRNFRIRLHSIYHSRGNSVSLDSQMIILLEI